MWNIVKYNIITWFSKKKGELLLVKTAKKYRKIKSNLNIHASNNYGSFVKLGNEYKIVTLGQTKLVELSTRNFFKNSLAMSTSR